MTNVYLHPTIAAALAKAEQKLGSGDWIANNPEQATLVASQPALRQLLADAPEGLIEAIGSTDAEVINTWLAERGYSFRLQPLGPTDIGVAASLDVAATWAKSGAPVEVKHGGVAYPAVKMEHRGYKVHAVGEHRVIEPQADRRVFMVMAADLEAGLAILREKMTPVDGVHAVVFPMIDHDAPVDLGWLIGLRHPAGSVSQALGQAKLRLNEFGVRAKTGVAASVYRSVPSNIVKIDEPFVLAFMVGDAVLVAFHVTLDAWKRPPALGGQKSTRAPGQRVVETW